MGKKISGILISPYLFEALHAWEFTVKFNIPEGAAITILVFGLHLEQN